MKSKYQRKVFSLYLVIGLAIVLLSSCSFQQNDIEIQDVEPVNTDSHYDVSTSTPVQTQTLLSDTSSTPTPTMEAIMLPDWVLEPEHDLYLCIAPDKNGEMRLAITNPASQYTFFFPISEADIRGYFWLPEPEWGVGWIERKLDRYALMDISTGEVEYHPITDAALEFLNTSYFGTEGSSPLDYKDHAYPLKMINGGNEHIYFVRQDVNLFSTDFSKNISPDQRYYVLEVMPKEDNESQIAEVRVYDFEEEQEMFVEITGVQVEYRDSVTWFPFINHCVVIGEYIIDISDGSIIQELPKSEQERAWHSNGEALFYNPTGVWSFSYVDIVEGVDIYEYNMIHHTTQKLNDIAVYFQHNDTFSLMKEGLYNLTYISSIDALGFSYFGFGTAEGYEMDTAGGYCLYSFLTGEINCITDPIEEMLIVLDESANYTAREEVVYAQWSNSNRFIAFFVRRGDDLPRILIFDLENEAYFFIENHYEDGPLGLWSP